MTAFTLAAIVGTGGLVGSLAGASTPAGPSRSPAPALSPSLPAGAVHGRDVEFSNPQGPEPDGARVLPVQGEEVRTPSALDDQATLIEERGTVFLLVPGAHIQSDLDQMMTIATSSGGFVAGTQTLSASSGTPARASATLQVPVHEFAPVLAQLKALGRVTALSTSATDVTGQYVDLEAQIAALDASRRQYLTIMTKAKTINGILAVQAQLDSLQSQLQQLEGQQQVMDNRTTYATLTINLAQRAASHRAHGHTSGLGKAWGGAVSGFVAGAEGAIRLAGPLAFAVLLGGTLLLFARWGWRSWRRPAPPSL